MHVLKLSCIAAVTAILFVPSAAVHAGTIADQVSPGFNDTDATECLQNAITTGDTLIVVRKMASPWIVRPIMCTKPDQEIAFDSGVVVIAKEDEFHGTGDCLLTIKWQGNNVTLTGYGATLRMRKQDYQDSNRYTASEHRHAINVGGNTGFLIQGFRIENSGGDGIYLGHSFSSLEYCSGTVRDVTCVGHHRQGVSVISVRDVTIENCRFDSTAGTLPMAGIDIEPNGPEDVLENLVVRNCGFAGNTGHDIKVALWHYHGPGVSDISITFDACTTSGSARNGCNITGIDDGYTDGPAGLIAFRNCVFSNSHHSGIRIHQNTEPAEPIYDVTFDTCSVRYCAIGSAELFPVKFYGTHEPGGTRNVRFSECSIIDTVDRDAIGCNFYGRTHGFVNVHGTITVDNPYGASIDIGDSLENVTLAVQEADPVFRNFHRTVKYQPPRVGRDVPAVLINAQGRVLERQWRQIHARRTHGHAPILFFNKGAGAYFRSSRDAD